MPSKKHKAPKTGPVWHRSAEEATLDRMPKYNAYACGAGAHGDAKYNRAKLKRTWQKELEQERTRNRGSFPLHAIMAWPNGAKATRVEPAPYPTS